MTTQKTIRVAVFGVGNCASSLIQGVQWYRNNPDMNVGLNYIVIGGYSVTDIKFVMGVDVDKRKVNRSLREAVFAKPNCAMKVVDSSEFDEEVVSQNAMVFRGPTLDGIPQHMRELPEEITFVEDDSDSQPIDGNDLQSLLKSNYIDVVLNYMPVGAEEAAKFYIENAVEAGVHVVNCMPSYISTEESMELERKAIENDVTIVGSDMRSQFGASRLSEVLIGSMLDSGLVPTEHVQMNMTLGSTQGEEHIINGRSSNTDFINMATKDRLKNKHISKENVLSGQFKVRDKDMSGVTAYAGPSLVPAQKPGGVYMGSDNKIANIDMTAFGWSGARYELTARMSVQDSPNSGGIVADAVRFCKTASELGVVGYLRGPSAWTQKTPPVQMTTSDSKFECDALARSILTPGVEKQLKSNNPDPADLDWTFQKSSSDYE